MRRSMGSAVQKWSASAFPGSREGWNTYTRSKAKSTDRSNSLLTNKPWVHYWRWQESCSSRYLLRLVDAPQEIDSPGPQKRVRMRNRIIPATQPIVLHNTDDYIRKKSSQLIWRGRLWFRCGKTFSRKEEEGGHQPPKPPPNPPTPRRSHIQTVPCWCGSLSIRADPAGVRTSSAKTPNDLDWNWGLSDLGQALKHQERGESRACLDIATLTETQQHFASPTIPFTSPRDRKKHSTSSQLPRNRNAALPQDPHVSDGHAHTFPARSSTHKSRFYHLLLLHLVSKREGRAVLDVSGGSHADTSPAPLRLLSYLFSSWG